MFCYLPETKGLTLQEIEEYYKELRPALVSQQRMMLVQKRESGSLSRKNLVLYRPEAKQKEGTIGSNLNVNTESKTSTTDDQKGKVWTAKSPNSSQKSIHKNANDH